MKLERIRKEIDEVDSEIVRLLNLRCALSRKAGILKTQANLPIVDSCREEEVMRSICLRSANERDNEALAEIYSVIIRASRELQSQPVNALAQDYLTV